MAVSNSPDVSGIKVSVATVTAGVPDVNAVAIGHLDSLGNVVDKSRAETKFTPINDTQYEEIVSLGSLSQNAFTMTVLYDPEGAEGVNLLEESIDDRTEVQLILEFNNKGTTNGTIIKQIVKCSNFTVTGEKDGKHMATFTASRIGSPTKTAAA